MLVQSPTPMQKLQILVNQIISLKCRGELAQRKQQLKTLLEEYSSTVYGLGLLEEFLGYASKDKKIQRMLLVLQECAQFGCCYEKICEELLKRYLQCNDSKQLLDEEYNLPIRLFLTRMMLQFSGIMQSAISLCKNDQDVCMKVLLLIGEYYQERKVVGNATSLVILCVNLLKIKERSQLALPLLTNAIKIINIIIQNMESIRKPLFPYIYQQIQQLFNSKDVIAQSIRFMSNYIKYSTLQSQSVSMIEPQSTLLTTWISNTCIYLTELSRVHAKKVSQKKYQLPLYESQCIVQFIINSYAYINKNVQEEIGINKLIIDTSMEIISIIHPSVNGKLVGFGCGFWRDCGKEVPMLRQCFANCMSYQFRKSKEMDQQFQVICGAMEEWEKSDYQLKSCVKKQFQIEEYPQNSGVSVNEHAESIFLQFIKKTIQNQFQLEFDKNLVNSVCNLFCHLSPIVVSKQNSKQAIIQFIKMLLNLNESCQHQYREMMVNNIIKILGVYSQQLLKDNQFLQEVLEDKLIQHLYSNKQEIIYLANQKMLSLRFYSKIYQKIISNQIFVITYEDILLLFQVMLRNDREAFVKNVVGWEWDAYVATAGVKVYGKEWVVDEKELRDVKNQKMLNYAIEFEDDIQKIQKILSSVEQKNAKK